MHKSMRLRDHEIKFPDNLVTNFVLMFTGTLGGLTMGDTYVEVPNADGHGNQAQHLNVDAPPKKFTDAGADGFDRSSMVYP